MAIGFGPPRRVLPPQNLGTNVIAQKRVAEAAVRAAAKTSVSISVDAHPARVWLRNPRGSRPCPCSSTRSGSDATPLSPTGGAKIFLPVGEGDDLGEVDSGFEVNDLNPQAGTENALDGSAPNAQGWLGDVARMLLGTGRRCGLCWGTGWLDGYRLWGGERILLCVEDTQSALLDLLPEDDVDVDLETPTPTMVGPGTMTWKVSLLYGHTQLDALRVRCGTQAADSGWSLQARVLESDPWIDFATFLGIADGFVAGYTLDSSLASVPFQVRLTLAKGARVSHVEMVTRGNDLLNMQMPQLSQSASAELVGPILSEEFEMDPIVGYVERGTLCELVGINGHLGSLWQVTDVTVKKTAIGQVFGVVGNVRNIQPTEVLACASMEDDLAIGILDAGIAPRGLEATGGGDPPEPQPSSAEDARAAVQRGISKRVGGGSSSSRVILLSSGEQDLE